MGIAYTAMLAAFYVDNGPHLPLWDRLPTQAFWLLPLVVAHLSSPALGTKRRPGPAPRTPQARPPPSMPPASRSEDDPDLTTWNTNSTVGEIGSRNHRDLADRTWLRWSLSGAVRGARRGG